MIHTRHQHSQKRDQEYTTCCEWDGIYDHRFRHRRCHYWVAVTKKQCLNHVFPANLTEMEGMLCVGKAWMVCQGLLSDNIVTKTLHDLNVKVLLISQPCKAWLFTECG